MKRLLNLLRRFRDWLDAVEPLAEGSLTPRDWADLPPHHPHCE
jgi:hypothetical protein